MNFESSSPQKQFEPFSSPKYVEPFMDSHNAINLKSNYNILIQIVKSLIDNPNLNRSLYIFVASNIRNWQTY